MVPIKLVIAYSCLIFLLTRIPDRSNAVLLPNEAAESKIRRPKLRASVKNSGELKSAARLQPKRGCYEMFSRSECSKNQECRWCQSDALDDMCFSKPEAWRLPSQVFSCEF